MVNLLPWRELQRKRKKNSFIIWQIYMGFVALIVIVILYVIFYSCLIAEKSSAALLVAEDKQGGEYATQLRLMHKEREELFVKNKIINEVRLQRAKLLLVLQLLIVAIPDNVDLQSVKLEGNKLLLRGRVVRRELVADLNRVLSGYFGVENSLWEVKESNKNFMFILGYVVEQ